MRYLGILALTVSLSSPAVARKHQRRPAHVARHKPASVKPHPVEVARAEPAQPPAPPPPIYAAAQADDDEVPGKKHKK